MDFLKICRLCAKTPASGFVISIFAKDSDIIMMKLQACCPLEITIDDELPTSVCRPCYDKIDEFYNFRIQMLSAEQRLNRLIENGDLVKPKPVFELKEEELDIKEETNEELLQRLDEILGSDKDANFSDSSRSNYKGEEAAAQSSDYSYSSDESQNAIKEENRKKSKNLPKMTSVCPICGKELLRKSYVIHMNNVHELGLPSNTFDCDNCDKKFKTKERVKAHMKTHAGITYNCDKCEKSFKSQLGFSNHTNHFHLGKRKHICNICDKAFYLKRHLKHHLLGHTGEKPYVCSLCPMSFTNSWNLKMHYRRHDNLKPHTCDQCGKTFVQNIDLKAHVKRNHSETPKKRSTKRRNKN